MTHPRFDEFRRSDGPPPTLWATFDVDPLHRQPADNGDRSAELLLEVPDGEPEEATQARVDKIAERLEGLLPRLREIQQQAATAEPTKGIGEGLTSRDPDHLFLEAVEVDPAGGLSLVFVDDDNIYVELIVRLDTADEVESVVLRVS